MPIDQIDSFMNSISALESGHNYDALGPRHPDYGHAKGRYQMMEKFYPAWAKEAGVSPTDWSAAAQDRVARHRMSKLYNKYGSWDLVAMAWFAGEGTANKAVRNGFNSVANRSDSLGTNVSSYVSKVVSGMGKSGNATPTGTGTATAVMEQPLEDPQMSPEQADQMTQESLGQILSTISETVRSGGGGQVLDLKGLFGIPESDQPIDAMEATAEPELFMEGIPDPSDVKAKEAPKPSTPAAGPSTISAPANPRQADGPMAAPPKHSGFDGLKPQAKVNSQRLMGQFPGMRFTSGYRDPKRNAAAGGVATSKHLTGEASDFVGTESEMKAAAAWAKSQGAKVLIHNSGSGRHLHIEW